jgi:hypothetical protein
MTDTPDTWSLTPDQATAALAELHTVYKATQPVDPQAELKAAADQNLAAAMSGTLPDVRSSEQRLMQSTASWLRELEFPDPVIEQALSGRPVPQKEFDMVKAHREKMLTNADWTKKLLAGDLKARQQLTAMNIIIVNGAEETAA